MRLCFERCFEGWRDGCVMMRSDVDDPVPGFDRCMQCNGVIDDGWGVIRRGGLCSSSEEDEEDEEDEPVMYCCKRCCEAHERGEW